MDFNYRVIPENITIGYEDVFDVSIEGNVKNFVKDKDDMISGIVKLLNTVDEESRSVTDIYEEIERKLRDDFDSIFERSNITVHPDYLITNYVSGSVKGNNILFNASRVKNTHREIMDVLINDMRSLYLLSDMSNFNRIKGVVPRFEDAMKKCDAIGEDEVFKLADDVVDYCRFGIITHCINILSNDRSKNNAASEFMKNLVERNSFMV